MALVKTGAVEYGGRKVEFWGDLPESRDESRMIQKKKKKPVIIYEVSPKIIHVEASEFMALVQQLTGHTSSSSATNHADEGNPRRFPVKVKARLLKRDGTEKEEELSISPSSFSRDSRTRKCDGFQEGDSMASENWFEWGDYK